MQQQTGKLGQFIHMDVISSDPKRTQRFYEAVFGWKFQKIPFAGYSLFEARAPPHGGLRKPEADERPGTFAYLAVPSVDEAAKKIVQEGGRVLIAKQKVPGIGWRLVFEAPGGVVQGVFEEKAGE